MGEVTGDIGASRYLLPELARIPGHVLWRTHARAIHLLDRTLPDEADIHAYAVLLALADGRPRSQQELADTVATSRTTLAKVAAALARRGLVERVRNPDDRRSYALTRTPAGAAATEDWAPHVDDAEAALTAALSDAEHARLLDLLVRSLPELSPDAPTPLVASVGFLATRMHLWMHRDYSAAMEPLGIEPRQLGTLEALTARGDVAQAELARMLGTSAVNVVQIVDGLERAGLAERRRLPQDRRSYALRLLPPAADTLVRAREISRDLTLERFAALSPAELDDLLALLVRVVTGEPG